MSGWTFDPATSAADRYLIRGLTALARDKYSNTVEDFDEQLGGWLGDAIHHVVHGVTDVVKNALPIVGGVVGGIYGGPSGAMTGFKLGSVFMSAQQAKDAGDDAEKQYAKAASLAQYLQAQGIDTQGTDPAANALIAQLAANGYEFQTPQAQALIQNYVAMKREEESTNKWIYVGSGVLVVGGLLYWLTKR